MLTQAAQDLINQVQNTVSIEAASAAAMTILMAQTGDLQAKIAALPAMGTMSSDDLAAIKVMAADLEASAVKLQAAIPAAPIVPPVAPAPAPVAVAPAVPPVAPTPAPVAAGPTPTPGPAGGRK